MKKHVLLGSLISAAVLAAPAYALDRANTAQKGSLLVFPKIDVSPGRDTLIRIENGFSTAVDITCYYQNGEKFTRDVHFRLTPLQPQVIIASEEFPTDFGPLPGFGPRDRGEVKCWAVSRDGQNEMSFNHLAGTATIIDFEANTADEYTAWAFRCLNPTDELADCGATPGVLLLDGTEYESCPKKLTVGFSPTGAFGGLFGPSTLHVATCNQDFQQDKNFFFTKLNFTVVREDERVFTGAFSCIDSWHETTLDGVQNNPANFSLALLGNNARVVIKGVPSNRCAFPTSPAGLVGVISTQIGADVASTNLVGYGSQPGFIFYDAFEPIEQRPE